MIDATQGYHACMHVYIYVCVVACLFVYLYACMYLCMSMSPCPALSVRSVASGGSHQVYEVGAAVVLYPGRHHFLNTSADVHSPTHGDVFLLLRRSGSIAVQRKWCRAFWKTAHFFFEHGVGMWMCTYVVLSIIFFSLPTQVVYFALLLSRWNIKGCNIWQLGARLSHQYVRLWRVGIWYRGPQLWRSVHLSARQRLVGITVLLYIYLGRKLYPHEFADQYHHDLYGHLLQEQQGGG